MKNLPDRVIWGLYLDERLDSCCLKGKKNWIDIISINICELECIVRANSYGCDSIWNFALINRDSLLCGTNSIRLRTRRSIKCWVNDNGWSLARISYCDGVFDLLGAILPSSAFSHLINFECVSRWRIVAGISTSCKVCAVYSHCLCWYIDLDSTCVWWRWVEAVICRRHAIRWTETECTIVQDDLWLSDKVKAWICDSWRCYNDWGVTWVN